MTEIKLVNTFKSFWSRMWLDYSDEHITDSNRLNEKEYVERYHDWLLEKWQNRDYTDDGDS